MSDQEHMDPRQELWDELRAYDKKMPQGSLYGPCRHLTNLPGKIGKTVTIGGYRVAQVCAKFQLNVPFKSKSKTSHPELPPHFL